MRRKKEEERKKEKEREKRRERKEEREKRIRYLSIFKMKLYNFMNTLLGLN